MRRVLFDYTQGLYQPAAAQYRRLAANGFTGARALADWKQRVRQAWPRVSLRLLTDAARDLPRGERLRLRVAAGLNGLPPPMCAWSSSLGGCCRRRTWRRRRCPPTTSGRARDSGTPRCSRPMSTMPTAPSVFALDVEPPECGQFRTEIRIYPWHELLSHPYELGLDEMAVSAASVAQVASLRRPLRV